MVVKTRIWRGWWQGRTGGWGEVVVLLLLMLLLLVVVVVALVRSRLIRRSNLSTGLTVCTHCHNAEASDNVFFVENAALFRGRNLGRLLGPGAALSSQKPCLEGGPVPHKNTSFS